MTTEKTATATVATTERLSLANMPKFANSAEELKWLKAYEQQKKADRDAEKAEEKKIKDRQKAIAEQAAKDELKANLAIYQLPTTKVQVNIRWTPKDGFPDGKKEGYKTLTPDMSKEIEQAIANVLKACFNNPF